MAEYHVRASVVVVKMILSRSNLFVLPVPARIELLVVVPIINIFAHYFLQGTLLAIVWPKL